MQRKGMEGSGSNIPGMQTLLNAFVHLLGSLTAKSQQQNLIGNRFAGRQKPACTRHQYRRFAASCPCEHQQRLLAIDYRASLRRVERRRFHRTEKSAYWVSMASVGHGYAPADSYPYRSAGLTLTPGVATVVELIKTRYGNRQAERARRIFCCSPAVCWRVNHVCCALLWAISSSTWCRTWAAITLMS